MKIRVDDTTMAGTPTEIMKQLQEFQFFYTEGESLDEFMQNLNSTARRINCAILPINTAGSEDDKARAVLKAIARLNWLIIEGE